MADDEQLVDYDEEEVRFPRWFRVRGGRQPFRCGMARRNFWILVVDGYFFLNIISRVSHSVILFRFSISFYPCCNLSISRHDLAFAVTVMLPSPLDKTGGGERYGRETPPLLLLRWEGGQEVSSCLLSRERDPLFRRPQHPREFSLRTRTQHLPISYIRAGLPSRGASSI